MAEVTDAEWVLAVTDDQLISVAGAAAAARGIRYAAAGRVASVTATQRGDVVSGVVQGSRARPYRAVVTRTGWSGPFPAWVSQCSCPMGSDCKHVVAVLRVARSQLRHGSNPGDEAHTRPHPERPVQGNVAYLTDHARRSSDGRDHHPAYRHREPGSLSPVPPRTGTGPGADRGGRRGGGVLDWESVLRPLVDPGSARPAVDAGSPCGLVVDLVPRLDPRGRDEVSDRVRLRATRQTKSGRWAKTMLAWSDIAVPSPTHPLREAHRLALAEIVALHRASGAGSFGYAVPEILLDDLGPAIWPVLRRAVTAGVALLAGSGDPPPSHPWSRRTPAPATNEPLPGRVHLARDGVDVVLDLHRDDLGLVVAPRLVGVATDGPIWLIGGTVRSGYLASPRRAAASPVHGVARQDEAGLWLAALTTPLDPALAALLTSEAPLRVPTPDVERFLALYYPQLSRRTTVTSSDGSVELPRLAPPRLLVRVESQSVRRIDVHLAMLYPGSVGDVVLPLVPDAATGPRDQAEEEALLERLEILDTVPGLRIRGSLGATRELVDHVALTEMAAVDFVTRIVPDLQTREDVVVDFVGERTAYRESAAPPVVHVDALDATSGTEGNDRTDWFDLRVRIDVGGQQVPYEPLFGALARGDDALLLDSGIWFRLDRPELDRLRRLIEEARELADPRRQGVRLSRYHVGLWDDLVEIGVAGEQSRLWQDTVAAFHATTDESLPSPPPGLKAELRPYQVEGYAWLARLWDAGLGGILADDMGLGKTLQALAMILRAARAGDLTEPVLVVAPTSVVPTWAREAAAYAPELRVVTVTETERRRPVPLGMAIAGAQVVVTSYALLRIDEAAYRALSWRAAILDEAQFVKNHRAKTYLAARRLGAASTFAMTGTPLENSLMDLWSLLSIVAPGLYPRPEGFAQVYRRPIESGSDPEALDRLRRRIKPLVLRRTKDEVAGELPPKQEQVVAVPLAPAHATVYQRHLQRERQRILGLLADPDANRVAILSSLTLLRQLSLHPGLVDDGYAVNSPCAKLDLLVDHLAELAAEGHRALVFSQFTRFLRMARERLAEAGIESCYLDGRTKDRGDVVERFRSGDAPAFLISLKAGGFGLTLTEADYVYVLDPWWNPAAETQAIDRAHRIGQQRQVMVYRLVSEATVEEKVIALQDRKRELFSQVLDGGGFGSASLSPDDIRELLAAPSG